MDGWNKLNIIGFITAVLAVNNVLGFTTFLSNPYYMWMGLCFILLIILYKGWWSINNSILFVIIAAILSTWANNPPGYFRSWERLISFILVAGLLSPLIVNDFLKQVRDIAFKWVLVFSQPIVLVSLIAYFLGISMAENPEAPFSGITNHSMLLAPIASFTLLIAVSQLFSSIVNTIKTKIYYSILLVVSGLIILLTGSRTALIAALGATVFMIYKINRDSLMKFIGVILLSVILSAASYPLWASYMDTMTKKNEAAKASGSMTSSRDSKWEARLIEFNSNPLFGVGYAAVLPGLGDEFDVTTGQVEPGSSWLALLSMLGLMGFVPLIALVIKDFIFLFKNEVDLQRSSMLGALLFFFIVHMTAEGYIFGAGGYLFFMFWLLLGVIDNHRRDIMMQINTYTDQRS